MKNSSLEVIGAGLMRSGGSSLKIALEDLLRGRCYTMFEILTNKNKADARFLTKAVINKIKNGESGYTKDEWREFYKDYIAAVDHPSCVFFEELMDAYPEAKVILTERDPGEWVRSVRQTTMHAKRRGILIKIQKLLDGIPSYFTLADGVRTIALGNIDMNNDEELALAYVKWNNYVKQIVPANRLLVMKPPFQWSDICSFLDKPVPMKSYPHVNAVKDFQRNVIEREQRVILKIKLTLYVAVGFISLFLLFFFQGIK